MTEHARPYPGGELALFRHARNWKAYVADRLRPYVAGEVAEAGAGLGAMTAALFQAQVTGWLCLEPDPAMAAGLAHALEGERLPALCRVRACALADAPDEGPFDAILYIDVLEHIEDDRAELAGAARRLRPGGFLVVLSPAHPWLFSPFDQAIGHFRRYSRGDAADLSPSGVSLVTVEYLDSVGLLASLANKVLLHASMPTLRQILVWDRLMVPVSRVLDRALFGRVGKSVLFVWRLT